MRANINVRNPASIRRIGLNALKRELGTVGATYFLRQFSIGQGDYTTERDTLLQGITLEDVVKNVRELDAQKVLS